MEAPQISVVKAVDLCLAVVERRIFFMLCCLCYLWFLCMMFLRRTYLLAAGSLAAERGAFQGGHRSHSEATTYDCEAGALGQFREV